MDIGQWWREVTGQSRSRKPTSAPQPKPSPGPTPRPLAPKPSAPKPAPQRATPPPRPRTVAEANRQLLNPGQPESPSDMTAEQLANRRITDPRWNLEHQDAKPGRTTTGAKIPGQSKPDTSDYARRSQQLLNTSMRRSLTTEEFSQLSPAQQDAVRFNTELLKAADADAAGGFADRRNTELLKAADADAAGGFADRRNTEALVSQLGVGTELEKRIRDGLGFGVGPAVRYDDLFAEGGTPRTATTTPSQYGGPAVGTLVAPTTERQRLVNAIAASLPAYLGAADTAASEAAATTQKDSYTFPDEQAKGDYELSFDYLLDPAQLNGLSWADAAADLTKAGYDPEDFKRYARNRIALMPLTAGRTKPEDLDYWFGG